MSLFQSTGDIIAKNPPAVKAFAVDLEYFSYVFLVSRSLNSSLLFSLRLLRFSARISSLSGSLSQERCRRGSKIEASSGLPRAVLSASREAIFQFWDPFVKPWCL